MDKTIIVALIASGTSIATLVIFKPIIDRYFLKFQLRQTYKAEQAKKVKDHIAIHKGILLQCVENLHGRLKNYAKNHSEPWLKANGNYIPERYYLDSTVYRFLVFFAQIKIIEKDLIYIDTVIAQKKDLRMLKYFKLFHIIMCDVDLFENHVYDANEETDHFFSNSFYSLSNSVIDNKQIIDFEEFIMKKPIIISKIEKIYKYFDSINPNESRLRCERLKILHLALIVFLNEYGYDYHKTDTKKLKFLKQKLGTYTLIDNFRKMIKKVKLNKTYSDPFEKVIEAVE
jgi:hypothetical protein